MNGNLWKFLSPGGQLGFISKIYFSIQVQKIIKFLPLPFEFKKNPHPNFHKTEKLFKEFSSDF
jgi:hypothetical protein